MDYFGNVLFHTYVCLISDIPGAAVNDAVLLKTKEEYVEILQLHSNLSHEEFEGIFNFLVYDMNLKNNDAILQPFIPINDSLFALAPHLLLASRPERNLITLIHKKKDRLYFNLTNQREQLMQNYLANHITANAELSVITSKELSAELPDIDYALYDISNKTILLCELKWLVEPDSAQELAAREEDLLHGCQQVQRVIDYATANMNQFMSSVFGEKTFAEYKFIPCVISKKVSVSEVIQFQ